MYVSDEYRASRQNAPAWICISLIWVGWVVLTIGGFCRASSYRIA